MRKTTRLKVDLAEFRAILQAGLAYYNIPMPEYMDPECPVILRHGTNQTIVTTDITIDLQFEEEHLREPDELDEEDIPF